MRARACRNITQALLSAPSHPSRRHRHHSWVTRRCLARIFGLLLPLFFVGGFFFYFLSFIRPPPPQPPPHSKAPVTRLRDKVETECFTETAIFPRRRHRRSPLSSFQRHPRLREPRLKPRTYKERGTGATGDHPDTRITCCFSLVFIILFLSTSMPRFSTGVFPFTGNQSHFRATLSAGLRLQLKRYIRLTRRVTKQRFRCLHAALPLESARTDTQAALTRAN